jgi:signal transduction histidine kinase
MAANPRTARPPLVAAALAGWLVLAAGWSYFLLDRAYARFVEQTMLDQARESARAARFVGLQPAVDRTAAADPGLAYAMAWSEDGRVLAHSDHRPDAPVTRGSFLDVRAWPALDPAAATRVRDVPLRRDGTTLAALEATIPLPSLPPAAAPALAATSGRVFISVAYPRDHLRARFWQAARPLLAYTTAFAVGGAILLAALLRAAFRKFDATRREIEQTARARTSLLTERGMLASVLAHEVRSPLTALRFNLHTLRSLLAADAPPGDAGGAPDRRVELTDRCEREIRRLDGMLNDFLLRTQLLTPADPGGGASVNAVVREAVDFLTPALDRHHIRVSLHLDPAAPRVQVHPDELRQVLLNLATNAQEAMPPPKGGTLAISTLAPAAAAPAAGGPLAGQAEVALAAVTLLIRDSGVGIPPEHLERVFEPFFSTKPNGSGLGLALVRRVVSGAGGTVTVESAPAAGTTFRVLLPPAAPAPPAGRGAIADPGGQ